jgi:hypothetical protein
MLTSFERCRHCFMTQTCLRAGKPSSTDVAGLWGDGTCSGGPQRAQAGLLGASAMCAFSTVQQHAQLESAHPSLAKSLACCRADDNVAAQQAGRRASFACSGRLCNNPRMRQSFRISASTIRFRGSVSKRATDNIRFISRKIYNLDVLFLSLCTFSTSTNCLYSSKESGFPTVPLT